MLQKIPNGGERANRVYWRAGVAGRINPRRQALSGGSMVRFVFEAEVIYWRGPSPFFYAPVPAEHLDELRAVAKAVTYGWGVVPVAASVRGVSFTTSLFPKDGTYLLPLKAAVRKQANVTAGDRIAIEMTVGAERL
jgi:hypothetical protein